MKNKTMNKNYNSTINSLPENIGKMFENTIISNMKNGHSKENLDAYFKELTKEEIKKPVISVGAGTCGLGAGADMTLEAVNNYIKTNNIDAEIVETGCIGYCAVEPLVDIQMPGKNRILFQEVTADKVETLLDSIINRNTVPEGLALGQFRNPNFESWKNIAYLDEHPFFAPQQRCVLTNCGIINPESIEEYIALGGYGAFLKTINTKTSEEVCNDIEESGLRGRGGGGFPTGKKWKFALSEEADQKYMVCNADEGDPGAFMDRAVIEGDPHRLLEGLAIAAYAIGATKAYIYIRAEYPLAIKRLKIAIEEAKKYGLIGKNIYDSGFDLDIVIKMGAGAFVCGEETALIHSIEGKRGMPRPRPPFPAKVGVFNKPTIINNVESLANVPDIILKGSDWFSSIGTENSKGTKVFALSGKVKRTGLIEVAMGTSLKEIIYEIGGGITNDKKLKAVQIGGPSGGCIPISHIDIEINYESLKEVGAMIGSGGLVVMDEDNCMVDVAKFFMDFIQRESCGKCIPCREGTKKMLEILNNITRHRRSEKGNEALDRFNGIIQLERLSEVIQQASLCGLGQTAPNPVLSTLRWFRSEYEDHIFERKCSAKACTELLTYSIDPDLCKGCMACLKKCPTEAIMGQKKTPHYIIPDKCIGCGNCATVCRFNAVKVS